MASLGTDIASLPDLDPLFGTVSEIEALGEALARRYETPRGSLWYAPDYGYDLRGRLGDSLTTSDLAQMPGDIEAEALKDERVQSAAAIVTFDASAATLTVTLTGTTAIGPFQFVLAVSALTVNLLSASSQ